VTLLGGYGTVSQMIAWGGKVVYPLISKIYFFLRVLTPSLATDEFANKQILPQQLTFYYKLTYFWLGLVKLLKLLQKITK